MNSSFWHSRFLQQASWTAATRDYLFGKAGISPKSTILEVGCGTGAVLSTVHHPSKYGIDINYNHLNLARSHDSVSKYLQADALDIPFPDNHFDIVFFHYFLLWVKSPAVILKGISRVTKKNGFIIAFAEPDYSGRIDYPDKLNELGDLQAKSLSIQGADPYIGRRLPQMFSKIEVTVSEFGVINGQWIYPNYEKDFDIEWQVIEYDLSNIISSSDLEKYKNIEVEAHKSNTFVRFIPTFYLIANKE